MKKTERINYIANILSLQGIVRIRELAQKLGVSEMTIRRDLDSLAQTNVADLIPGGAVLKKTSSSNSEEEPYFFSAAGSQMIQEKIKICRKAISLVEAGDTIAIDTGSTTEQLPQFIPTSLPLTIICFTLNILFKVYGNENWEIIFTGGRFHRNSLMFESPEGVELIKKMRINKAFISAAGVDETLGVTCANQYEVETKRAAMKSSDTKILLADSSKFGKVKIAYFADLSDFDLVITDSGLDPYYQDVIRDVGLQLLLV
ncbi:MAG: DeoR family transcriptional regulator, deoxyribose operon repressor [Candidatus Atribacteria bacterium]|nr:DeoR family transcriptional regulator, deoxyribose operon repressor [Candidatus Atribacteria bacterium]